MIKKVIIFILIVTLPSFGFANTKHINYEAFLQFMCQVHGVPYEVAYAVAIVESGFNMNVSSLNSDKSFDIGIFQLNSKYIDWFEDEFWHEGESFDAYNIENNIEMGVILLKNMYDRTNKWESAVRAYHLGMTGFNTYPEASDYYFNKVERVILR